jgi:hypothetical protein
MVFGGSGLIYRMAFGGSGLIYRMVFGGSGLIYRMGFGGSGLGFHDDCPLWISLPILAITRSTRLPSPEVRFYQIESQKIIYQVVHLL